MIKLPARLVYAPKVYAYVKQQSGAVLDLTQYVVSGEVQRKINQVSSATVTLRNPYRKFTSPNSADGVAFHPMDPITIYLERIRGYPVRVFTGYLDTTPYYQLYPKTVTLQASCTLKRLLYTFFDPSLPFVYAFFYKYGWTPLGDGTAVNFSQIQQTVDAKHNTLNDSSLGKLLWAILYDIGQWQDGNIYIENLPSNLVQKVAQLATNLETAEKTAVSDFESFLKSVIGQGSQGSGGGAAGGGGGSNSNSSGNILSGSGSVPNTPSGGYTRESWAVALLKGLGFPTNPANVTAIHKWEDAENTNAKYNPLATSQTMPGSTAFNSANVQNYTSWKQGLEATIKTLNNSHYPNILADLKAGKGNQIGNSPDLAAWGTSPFQSFVASASNAIPTAQRGTTPLTHTDFVPAVKHQSGATAPAQSGISTVASTVGNTASRVGSAVANSTVTRIDAMISAAATINNKKYPYSWGGGHERAGTPSIHPPHSDGSGTPVLGFDCSGAVAAVLSAANLIKPGSGVGRDDSIPPGLKGAGFASDGPGAGTPECTIYDKPGVHTYMRLNGKYWGTSNSNPGGGAGWFDVPEAGFIPYHVPTKVLNETTTYAGPTGNASGAPSNTGGTGGSANNANATAFTNAFVAEIELPSLQDQVTAVALGEAHMGLMHDQSLMPFVQQVTQASMRSFQSLPNGDFYAFYPDYFGEFGHHKPYWLIDDIEILDGEINLTDDSLATHVFAVGDTTWPVGKTDGDTGNLLNMLQAGTINIQNAFAPTGLLDRTKGKGQTSEGYSPLLSAEEAVQFIKRYGARPLVQQYPMVRNPIFEMFLAYQQFMLAWSNQFKTPFTFTFMPELFPGGKVGFPSHGLQMYVSSVTHSWDYAEGGFTTSAELTAPSVFGNNTQELPPNMVEALVEPVRSVAKNSKTQSPPKAKQTTQQTVSSIVDETAQAVEQAASSILNSIF